MPSQFSGYGYVVDASTDPMDPKLKCEECGEELCSIEDEDSLGTLIALAEDHDPTCKGAPDDGE